MASFRRNTGERAVAAILIRRVQSALRSGDCRRAVAAADDLVQNVTRSTAVQVVFDRRPGPDVQQAASKAAARAYRACGR
jgi:hypothetical protein